MFWKYRVNILGISAFFHDSAAALVRDGRILAAAEEERFSRRKHDDSFPTQAAEFCLAAGDITAGELDAVVFYEKPLVKFERLLEAAIAYAPRGFRAFLAAMPRWLQTKLHIPREIDRGLGGGYGGPILFTTHHEAHAASAFYPSPFDEAAILTLDGVGEWSTATWGTGRGHRVRLEAELRFPHSLGLLYSAFTLFCGFRVNSGEYKLMGLAPYGEPRFVEVILQQIVDLRDDGSFWLDQTFFDYAAGLKMTSRRFDRLFGGPARRPDGPLTDRELDLAASIQRVAEEIVLRMARHVHAQTGLADLCLAGGVALNCVANGRLLREGPFRRIWIQPAAGDAGGAVGAALAHWHGQLGRPRAPSPADSQQGSFLGPDSDDAIAAAEIAAVGGVGEAFVDEPALAHAVAEELAAGRIVGHFAGRAEFGPRALGNRSILADPRRPEMQRRLNLAIKFRESFRPFAPAVLAGRQAEFFELEAESPFMLIVAPVRGAGPAPGRGLERLRAVAGPLPAVTHVDGSARVQTVDAGRAARFHAILEAFDRLTGCPVLANTSFNIRGEPIVHTPADAYRCFMYTDMDSLVVGNHLYRKERQPPLAGAEAYRRSFRPD
ncbi:MAG: hypothetical protein RLZZ440_2012 [Planctomycetota bacterium]